MKKATSTKRKAVLVGNNVIIHVVPAKAIVTTTKGVYTLPRTKDGYKGDNLFLDSNMILNWSK